jgi:hypothetical protein
VTCFDNLKAFLDITLRSNHIHFHQIVMNKDASRYPIVFFSQLFNYDGMPLLFISPPKLFTQNDIPNYI